MLHITVDNVDYLMLHITVDNVDFLMLHNSVHKLRPSDIKVVAAMGDSITVSTTLFLRCNLKLLVSSHVYIRKCI